MKNFKEELKNIPPEFFQEIEELLSKKYNMKGVKVTDLNLIPLDENPTEEDCARQGKRLKCKKRANGTIKCWCVRRL